VVQQLVIGITLGFAVRVVFAAVEFAGEIIGLQMGLNFAGFFDPATGRRAPPRAASSAPRWRGCSSSAMAVTCW
jgi:flagellar biosynthetic protein FliR